MEDSSNDPSPKKEVKSETDDASVTKVSEELDKNTSSSGSEFYEEDMCGNELVINKTLVDSNVNIKLPRMNVREKIIICLDLCADNDNDSTPFRYIITVKHPLIFNINFWSLYQIWRRIQTNSTCYAEACHPNVFVLQDDHRHQTPIRSDGAARERCHVVS
jgi:hypothetical protein